VSSASDDTPSPDRELEALFLAHLETIDRIVGALAARYRMTPDEEDDFGGWVRLRIIEDDYAVLRRHEGRSSLGSYLSVVIANLLRDRRIQDWGKWRPSAAARRAGPVGIRLERLVRRDGLPFDTAVRILRSRNGVALSDRELAELAATFPERTRPRIEADSETIGRMSGGRAADAEVRAGEHAERQTSMMVALEKSLDTLDAEERVILKLRFWEGLTVADIARALHLEQRPLYRRMNELLSRLRSSLESAEVTGDDLVSLLHEEGS
jgi:RNA polymerase sigma factor for flagellar operon FliA